MAHECPECGLTCHCNGDIDDICFGEADGACDHCDFPDIDISENEDPDHYLCLGCGHTQALGGECGRCTGHSMDPVFF